MKGIINAEWLATEIAGLIYRNGKAKMFNVLESQMNNQLSVGAMGDNPKMRATKRITEDLLETISKQAAQLIRDTLGDWQEEVDCSDDDFSPGEIKHFEAEHAEADKAAAGLCERINHTFKNSIEISK